MFEIEDYLISVDEKRQESFNQLYKVVKENIPFGFEETFSYGMISFVVPLDKYPKGYLNRKDEPLPFISLGVQKNHIAIYHMGIMENKDLLEWFQEEYRIQVPTKLNMGKSCIRMTNIKNIPFCLIGELVSKISLEEWIETYQTIENRKHKEKRVNKILGN